jgi:FkbH-like protein
MNIGLCGNISPDALAEALDAALPGHEIVVGRAGDFLQELENPIGAFRELDYCIVALDWRDLAPDLYAWAPGDDPADLLSRFQAACDSLLNAIVRHRSVCTARFLVYSPINDCCGSVGFIDRLQPIPTGELFADCQKIFNRACRSQPDLYPVDIEELCSRTGKDNAFDASRRYGEGQPFSALMIDIIARHLAQIITQFIKPPLKCIVLDCDNTLWGGVVGEAGIEHVVLDTAGPGRAFRDLQSEIYKRYKQGMILTICSKNNTCDALEVIEQHPAMILRPAMISSYRINWDDKPKGVLGISAELKIGLDAMLFIDDDPAERAMMRSVLPDVEVLELPQNPADYANTLRSCSRLWPLQLTADDREKGKFYGQERLRKQSRDLAANLEEYLMNSAIRVTIERANSDTLPRIVQLLNKANQFNLTTIRYSQSEIGKIIAEPGNQLFCMHMTDAYGDYGLVAAALIRKDTIDTFVLSCRAFGRQAESAFMSFLLQHIFQAGYSSADGWFIPSKRNAMTRDFYKNMGFVLAETLPVEKQVWRFDLNDRIPGVPAWIGVVAT